MCYSLVQATYHVAVDPNTWWRLDQRTWGAYPSWRHKRPKSSDLDTTRCLNQLQRDKWLQNYWGAELGSLAVISHLPVIRLHLAEKTGQALFAVPEMVFWTSQPRNPD